MHEVSLVRSIIRTLEDEFGAAGVARVRDVYLRVGLLSNVEPALMQNAFWAVQAAEGRYDHLTLHVEVLPILVVCELCGHQSTITNYRFACAACGRPTKNITQGTELLIHQVSFEEESQPVSPSRP
ncbi:hydrogenase expression protein (plasmid) [Hymenobacter psoromatis]|nr:hydrogenase expression protein [Hymenobacter psoromatis]